MIKVIKRSPVNRPAMRHWGFINCLFDLIWITVTLFMTNKIMSHLKIFENIQYKVCIVITGAIKGTSRELLFDEMGLESLGDRRWCQKLTFFYKTFSIKFFWLINPLSTSVALMEKPVNWFAQIINWLVSIWGQHWHLLVKYYWLPSLQDKSIRTYTIKRFRTRTEKF